MLIQIILNLFLTFSPLSQVAPNCEEDVGQVEEGGWWGSFNEEFKHKRKKTSSTSCQWSESRHGESQTFDFLVSTSLDRVPLVQVGRVGGAHLPNFPRTFNGSENDLTLAYNSSLTRPLPGGNLPGGRVRYNPDGRTSPEVGELSWKDTDIKAFK